MAFGIKSPKSALPTAANRRIQPAGPHRTQTHPERQTVSDISKYRSRGLGPFLAGRDTLYGWATLWPLDGCSDADETIRPFHEWAGTLERYWQHSLGAVNLNLPKFLRRSRRRNIH